MKKNKDPNYVAKLEKAIAEKYGSTTIQNPMSFWDDEKEELHKEESENRTCPVCDAYSFDLKDNTYMKKFNCCKQCFFQWVEGREDRWKTGWRPNNGNNT